MLNDVESRRERVAVIATCFNRRELSVATIRTVLEQASRLFDVTVYVTDDGSTDGTGVALQELGDRIEVIQGSGSLYWAGGMRVASARALQYYADWYVWVNDDLEISPTTFQRFYDQKRAMLEDEVKTTVFVGSVVDQSTGVLAYGRRSQDRQRPLSFALTPQSASSANSFNGNLVIFPSALYRDLGGFPQKYRHGYADYVMGLNVSESGNQIVELRAPPSIDNGGLKNSAMFDPAIPLLRRIRAAMSVFGLPPVDHMRFCRRVAGRRHAMIWFARSYASVFFPRKLRRRG